MGEADRYIDYKIKKQRFTLGQPDNALVWLFIFNAVFFLTLLVIKTSIAVNDNADTAFYTKVLPWFLLPASFGRFIEQPWSLITYMFSDAEVFRILSNMLWLWAFGSIFQNLTGNKKLIPVYLYGGLAGALFFMLSSLFVPSNSSALNTAGLLGANASVMAVAIAATMVAPTYRFFRHIRNGIPIWVLTVIYVAIDLAGVADKPVIYPVAHIGGAFAGFLFVKLLQHKIDGSVWMNNLYHWFINLFNPEKGNRRNTVKEKVFYNTGNRQPFNKKSNVTEQRIDEILDKINQKGYDHLTKDEKEILKRASEE